MEDLINKLHQRIDAMNLEVKDSFREIVDALKSQDKKIDFVRKKTEVLESAVHSLQADTAEKKAAFHMAPASPTSLLHQGDDLLPRPPASSAPSLALTFMPLDSVLDRPDSPPTNVQWHGWVPNWDCRTEAWSSLCEQMLRIPSSSATGMATSSTLTTYAKARHSVTSTAPRVAAISEVPTRCSTPGLDTNSGHIQVMAMSPPSRDAFQAIPAPWPPPVHVCIKTKERFVNHFVGKIPGNIKLEGPNGIVYDVEVTEHRNRTILQSGWEVFVDANNIVEKDSLMFRYRGRSHFKVAVFDSGGCEKRVSCAGIGSTSSDQEPVTNSTDMSSSSSDRNTYSSAGRRSESSGYCRKKTRTDATSSASEDLSGEDSPYEHESSDSDDHTLSEPLYFLSGQCYVTEEQEAKIVAPVQEIQPEMPLLVAMMKKPNVKPYPELVIPTDYTIAYFPQKSQIITLQMARQSKTWHCKFRVRPDGGRCNLYGCHFVRDNNFLEGDLCLFQPMTNGDGTTFTMMIHVLRKASTDHPSDGSPVPVCVKEEQSDASGRSDGSQSGHSSHSRSITKTASVDQLSHWFPGNDIWSIVQSVATKFVDTVALDGYALNEALVPVTTTVPTTDAAQLLADCQQQMLLLHLNLEKAQAHMKLYAVRHRTERQFKVGDKVWLRLPPYLQHPVANCPFPKLAHKFYGPYVLLRRVGHVAYELQLPDGCQIHHVFHVCQLKPYTADSTPEFLAAEPEPPAFDLTVNPSATLERRLVHRGGAAAVQLKIAWDGLPSSVATWEDYEIMKQRFPSWDAWGQASISGGATVMSGNTAMPPQGIDAMAG